MSLIPGLILLMISYNHKEGVIMRAVINTIQNLGASHDGANEYYALHHKIISSILMLIGFPVLAVSAVMASATAIMLPFAWAFGWL